MLSAVMLGPHQAISNQPVVATRCLSESNHLDPPPKTGHTAQIDAMGRPTCLIHKADPLLHFRWQTIGLTSPWEIAKLEIVHPALISDLIVIGFPKVEEAEQVRRELVTIQQQHLIALEDACVLEHGEDGHVHLKQAINLATLGASSGSFWGILIGLLFLNPIAGLAFGAGAGALALAWTWAWAWRLTIMACICNICCAICRACSASTTLLSISS